MNYKQLSKIINSLIRKKVSYLNFSDCEFLGIGTSWESKTMLEMCGCDVEKVHDLFNVTLPKNTITKEKLMYLTLMN